MVELCASGLGMTAGDAALLRDVSMHVRGGELLAIIGENGSGKTTLMRALAGYSRPGSGRVLLDGQDVHAMPAALRGQSIGWLPQTPPPAWPGIVRDAIAVGRYAHGGLPGRLRDADLAAIDDALARCDLLRFGHAPITQLSGGELARVHLARTIVGQAPVLLVDEPVAALDPRHRIGVMRMLRDLADSGRAVVAILHDLTLVGRYATRILALRSGEVWAQGTPAEVLTTARIRELFDVEARVSHHEGWPVPTIVD